MRLLSVLAAAAALAACQPAAPPAHAPEAPAPAVAAKPPVTVGALSIGDARANPPPGGVTTGAAYMTIRNDGDAPDRLLSASSPATSSIELHTHRDMGGGVMRMARVEAVDIPAHGAVTFAPDGLHLMLFGYAPAGAETPITLRFEKAGEATVPFAVASAPAAPMAMDH